MNIGKVLSADGAVEGRVFDSSEIPGGAVLVVLGGYGDLLAGLIRIGQQDGALLNISCRDCGFSQSYRYPDNIPNVNIPCKCRDGWLLYYLRHS